MRNYCKFWFINAVIAEYLPNGTKVGTFENEFVARTQDELYDAFGIYAQSFQGTHRYVLTNIESAVPMYIELSKLNVYRLFRLLSTAFSNVVTTWETAPGNFSGTVPDEAFFPLWVDESPRDTWSKGK